MRQLFFSQRSRCRRGQDWGQGRGVHLQRFIGPPDCHHGNPKLQVGETAKLEVKDVAKIGAFLDMGLEKDLLLPFKEQTHPVRKGEQCLVTLYVDKSRRLAATMRVYSHMSNQSPYKAEDWVTGTIYEINETIGAFVAVDHKYYGLIPKKRSFTAGSGRGYGPGQGYQGARGRKLDLCVREKSYVQMGTDAEKVLKVMDEFDGVLPLMTGQSRRLSCASSA